MKLSDFKNIIWDMPLGSKFYVVNISDQSHFDKNSKYYDSFRDFCLDVFLNEHKVVKFSISTNFFVTIFISLKK